MALQQTAYLHGESVPQRDALQATVDALGFDCELDASYVPFKSEGYMPCILMGQGSGFEIYFEPAAECLRDFPGLTALVGNRNSAITFRWGGDMAECACVLIVCAALAKCANAIVHYQDDDIVYSTEQLIEEARAALQSV
jgi:hypothetical protein